MTEPHHDPQSTRRPQPTRPLKRLGRSLDAHNYLVLAASPFVISTVVGIAIWWLLASADGSATQSARSAAALAAAIVCGFGIPLAIYLRALFRRFKILRAALNTVDAELVITDRQGVVVQFNSNARRFYEARGEQLLRGTPEYDLIRMAAIRKGVPPSELSSWTTEEMKRRRKHLDSGEPVLLHDEVGNRYLQMRLAQLPTGHLVEMRTDVTALKEKELQLAMRERELENARNAAEASNRAKSEFLANMSHEIRTPMNGVVGMTELLLESELTQQQLHFARTVSSSALSLLTLINDILDFSKVEAGKLELDLQPFDLRATLDDIAALAATAAQTKGVELVLNYDEALQDRFVGDASRLRQVLTNLIGNAVKFTEQGVVEIRVEGEQCGDAMRLLFAIRDTGIGIPPDRHQQIFNVFEQVDGASNRRYEGTGLGLAITARLLQLMNSGIELESELGTGSTFRFSLQLAQAAQPLPSPEPAIGDLDGRTMLVVDDLPLNREILGRRAEAFGMQAILAGSGAEALELMAHMTPDDIDVAVFDYQMPGMDGHALCRAFKSDPALRSIPLVLLSSVDESLQGGRVRALGFAACLSKPMRAGTLRQTLLEALGDVAARSAPAGSAETVQAVKSAQTAEVTAAGAHGTSALRVLVVEDNEINQLVIGGLLESYDIEPEFADNGREGVEAVERATYDLVFMDLSMPEMNGLDATRAIRELETRNNRARCPIVALTANVMNGDRERCLEAGMDDFLAKPLQRPALEQALRCWSTNAELLQNAA